MLFFRFTVKALIMSGHNVMFVSSQYDTSQADITMNFVSGSWRE